MSLRAKVVLILLLVFALYGTVSYWVQRQVVFPSFVALEEEDARKNMLRVIQAVDREIELLRPSVSDWGNWDDTRQFIQDRNQEYLEANLELSTLESMEVNVINLYDLEGNLVWGMTSDLETAGSMDLGDISAGRLASDHVLLAGPLAGGEAAGLYMTPKGPMLVVSKPVLNNDAEGPSGGAVLMGRLFTNDAVERLADQQQLDLSIKPVSKTAAHPDWLGDAARHMNYSPFVLEKTDDTTKVDTVVSDIKGQPILEFHAGLPRDISARGQTAMYFALNSIMGVGAVLLLVLLVALQRMVLRPVTLLTEHATQVGERTDLADRIALDRSDEIGILAQEFDRMIDRLAEARNSLLEQSYHAGVAEMASGLLHNIGNAVTPLNLRLSSVIRRLREAPVAEVEQALAELADEKSIPEGRRSDLWRFLRLAGQDAADRVARATEDLEGSVAQVQHIQEILTNQERFSRAKQALEVVEMERLIGEAVDFLPDRVRSSITVNTDRSVGAVGPVRAARVALQQVINNLIINAAEAIAERRSKDPARIEVSVQREHGGDPAMGHFRFTDNGAGILPEHLPRIFERGFSTKQRATGLGLHWCANAVSAMGGRLSAESGGAGAGTTIDLLLPLDTEGTETLEERAA